MKRRRAVILLWALAGTALCLALVKFFAADVYRVESGSMRPTIFGGAGPDGVTFDEWVLVDYDGTPDLERFDLVVMKPRNGGNPLVKRVGGLPGESLLISDGDLLVEGDRLPCDAKRPEPVVVFDDRFLDVRQYFQFDSGPSGRWTPAGEEWVVNASDVAANSDAGMMFFHKDLLDSYLDQEQRRVPGLRQANDGILQCEALLEETETRARLRLQLVEQGDTFQLVLEANESGAFWARIKRRNHKTLKRADPHDRVEVLYESKVPVDFGEWHRFVFANVDDCLVFGLDDLPPVTVAYDGNEPHPAKMGEGQKSLGPRVGFGAEIGRARFRSILILRDVFFTDSGEHAVTSLLSLGPDEYFLLGDNSAYSTDSRHFGPVRAFEILGRPVAVVWPLSRMRFLQGAVEWKRPAGGGPD